MKINLFKGLVPYLNNADNIYKKWSKSKDKLLYALSLQRKFISTPMSDTLSLVTVKVEF